MEFLDIYGSKTRVFSFAPCFSQSLLLADFKENHSLKESIYEWHFVNKKKRVENLKKTSRLRRLEFLLRNLD